MRTKTQGVTRYFTAVWSGFMSVVILVVVAGATVDTTSLDVGMAIAAGVLSAMGGVIGFIHGITLFVARQHDARDVAADGDVTTDVEWNSYNDENGR